MGALAGKVVIVTGAGRGLGAAYARLAASEGACVIVNDRDGEEALTVAQEIGRAGGTAVADHADIGDWDAAGRLIEAATDRFGRLDGLINNAGLFYMSRPETEDPARVEAIVRVNVLGTMYCGLQALRVMTARRSGAIVNVTSGAQSGIASMAIYGATKGAVASLTYGWACDVAGSGVRVNAISPVARTRMYDEMLRHGDPRKQHTGSGTGPDEIAAVAVYLLSDRARHLNGQVVRADKPRLSLIAHPAELSPGVERERWTVEDVAQAFSRTLDPQLQPLGMVPPEDTGPKD